MSGNCPGLELVLPARKEAVETPFLEEMREAARTAVYRAMRQGRSRACRRIPRLEARAGCRGRTFRYPPLRFTPGGLPSPISTTGSRDPHAGTPARRRAPDGFVHRTPRSTGALASGRSAEGRRRGSSRPTAASKDIPGTTPSPASPVSRPGSWSRTTAKSVL